MTHEPLTPPAAFQHLLDHCRLGGARKTHASLSYESMALVDSQERERVRLAITASPEAVAPFNELVATLPPDERREFALYIAALTDPILWQQTSSPALNRRACEVFCHTFVGLSPQEALQTLNFIRDEICLAPTSLLAYRKQFFQTFRTLSMGGHRLPSP